jgi:hypothetical protein
VACVTYLYTESSWGWAVVGLLALLGGAYAGWAQLRGGGLKQQLRQLHGLVQDGLAFARGRRARGGGGGGGGGAGRAAVVTRAGEPTQALLPAGARGDKKGAGKSKSKSRNKGKGKRKEAGASPSKAQVPPVEGVVGGATVVKAAGSAAGGGGRWVRIPD